MAIIDFHILAQAVLYFCGFVAGFAVCVPIGVNRHNFMGKCILYMDVNWYNITYFQAKETSVDNCNFPIYFSVFGLIFYGIGMGGYNMYAVYKSSKDSTIGSQMWVMPFILLNAALGVTTFIVACMVSVGFKEFCDGLNKNILKDKGCGIAQTINWIDDKSSKVFQPHNYMGLMAAAQTAAWSCFLVFTLQVALGILRFIRNRRQRSRQTFNAAQASESTKDTKRIAELTPTA